MASVTQDLGIRWMIRADIPYVLGIENKVFEFPWGEYDLVRVLENRNCIGMVAECGDRILGYMIYELHKSRLQLLSLGVAPDRQRSGVGLALIRRLKSKLSAQHRNEIVTEVRETNLGAQKFFAAMGFRAIHVLRDFYPDANEDAYVMWYTPEDEACRGI